MSSLPRKFSPAFQYSPLILLRELQLQITKRLKPITFEDVYDEWCHSWKIMAGYIPPGTWMIVISFSTWCPDRAVVSDLGRDPGCHLDVKVSSSPVNCWDWPTWILTMCSIDYAWNYMGTWSGPWWIQVNHQWWQEKARMDGKTTVQASLRTDKTVYNFTRAKQVSSRQVTAIRLFIRGFMSRLQPIHLREQRTSTPLTFHVIALTQTGSNG